jgi:hypothetical protein
LIRDQEKKPQFVSQLNIILELQGTVEVLQAVVGH